MAAFQQAARKQGVVRIDGAVKQALEISRARLLFVAAFIVMSFLAITIRLIDLSIDGAGQESKHMAVLSNTDLNLSRGTIVDRNGVLLATNLQTYSLYADTRRIMDVKEAADGIKRILPDLDYPTLTERLASGRAFVWLKRHLHPMEMAAINNLGLPGLEFQKDEKRAYPHGGLMAHVLGMVGIDGEGLAGAEQHFDSELADPQRKEPLQLSLDVRVQNAMYKALHKKYTHHQAKGAAGIVMDVTNGEILAMVSLPDFDPNNPSKINQDDTFNHATKAVYEMGSTFKAFNHALALESGVTSMWGKYDAEEPVKIGRYLIRDHHAQKRVLSVPEIFMYSSNIGSARMADEIGPERQREFFRTLGLTERLALEIPETSEPLVPDRLTRISTLTMSFGHGIAVTPLHVAAGMAAMVNGGIYHSPTLLKQQPGKVETTESHRVISESTSRNMRKLLRLVVSNKEGTGKNANVEGYLVGGKTGTAEKPGENRRRYDRKRMVTSFVGLFPMDNPRYLVMSVMDEPKGTKDTWGFATAGWTAAPVVKDTIAAIAPVLGVKPVDEQRADIRKLFYINEELTGTPKPKVASR